MGILRPRSRSEIDFLEKKIFEKVTISGNPPPFSYLRDISMTFGISRCQLPKMKTFQHLGIGRNLGTHVLFIPSQVRDFSHFPLRRVYSPLLVFGNFSDFTTPCYMKLRKVQRSKEPPSNHDNRRQGGYFGRTHLIPLRYKYS